MKPLWFVLDMDEGVMGAFPTKKAALLHFLAPGLHYNRHTYGPGAYEYVWWYPGNPEDGDGFFLERLRWAQVQHYDLGGWDWAIRAWIKAGMPMGRLDQPCGRDEEEKDEDLLT